MYEYLSENFPRGNHYLVEEKEQNSIDVFFAEKMFNPSQEGRKHNLWGEFSRQIPVWGRCIGWVPNHFPLTFFSNTVGQEIANAIVSKQNKLTGEKKEIETARFLLEQIELPNLINRNPFFLSEGETKLIWFLCQWVKSPDYLIISYLPTSLSRQKINLLLKFLLNSARLSKLLNRKAPTFIMGYTPDDTQWCEKLVLEKGWKRISGFKFDV